MAMQMDKSLRFWNEEKKTKNIFSDSQGNVVKLAIWMGSKVTTEIRACVIKRHLYKILMIKENGITEQKCSTFKLPNIHHTRDTNILTQTVDWNPEHGDQIAVGLADSHVLHWNIETDKCISSHQAKYEKTGSKSRTLTCIQWSRKDPNVLIYGTKDPFINVWDVRCPDPVQEFVTDGVLDIKFDPFDDNQFAVASENHDVVVYDLRNASTDKLRSERQRPFKRYGFSAHDNGTLKCEWNPKIRNRLATSGRKSIKIWDLDYSKEYHLLTEKTVITTRNIAYSIKWSPHYENFLASHSHSSQEVEIWNIKRRFRPYRLFKENPLDKASFSKLGKLVIHWHNNPHALITLNTNNADLSMHARRDALNMENYAPSCSISCSPYDELSFVTAHKPNKRQVSLPPDKLADQSSIFTRPLKQFPERSYSEKFLYLAKNYRIAGDAAFQETCAHNAEVARSQSLLHVASNWALLAVLFAEEISVPYNDYNYEEEINFENMKRRKRSDTHNYSDRPMPTSESPESGEHDSDSESNIQPSYRYVTEGLEAESEEDYSEPAADWDMLEEAFTQQSLHTESTDQCEELSDNSSITDSEHIHYHSDLHQDTIASVPRTKTEMKLNLSGLTREMLLDLVNEGEVQSACSMVLVLGRKLELASHEDEDLSLDDLTEAWFHAYMDLLSRFKLWNVQAAVINSSTHRMKEVNRNSAIIAICTKCNNKYAELQNGVCGRCGPAAVCGICRMTVRGLYMWCQGCCHGGHPDHLRDWFKTHRLCPAACGHECEFS